MSNKKPIFKHQNMVNHCLVQTENRKGVTVTLSYKRY